MKRTWPIIGVRDVRASFHWYQSLFGQPETSPAHADFGQILDSDGTALLCLHEWGAHEHPSLMSPDHATPVNGHSSCFSVSMISARPWQGQALSSRGSKRSPTSTQTLELRSSHSEIPTGTASRSMRSLRPNKRWAPQRRS
jgi:hypothetical protein